MLPANWERQGAADGPERLDSNTTGFWPLEATCGSRCVKYTTKTALSLFLGPTLYVCHEDLSRAERTVKEHEILRLVDESEAMCYGVRRHPECLGTSKLLNV
jgi:hypothetical protein